jgi:hypothetical protein
MLLLSVFAVAAYSSSSFSREILTQCSATQESVVSIWIAVHEERVAVAASYTIHGTRAGQSSLSLERLARCRKVWCMYEYMT